MKNFITNLIIKFLENLELILLVFVTSFLFCPLIQDFKKVMPSYTIGFGHLILLAIIISFYLILGYYIAKHKK